MRLKVTYEHNNETEEEEGLMTHKDNVLMILRRDKGTNLILGWETIKEIHRVQRGTYVKVSLESFRKGRGNG